MIPLSAPFFSGKEWEYLKSCLDTGWVSSSGPFISQFEKAIAHYVKADYAVACVNGTSALHLSLLVAGVLPDDEVLVPTLTFIAPVNAVHYVQAHPVFMDCDDTYNLDVEKTRLFITQETVFKNGFSYSKKTGRRVSAVIPVHVFGHLVDLAPLISLCQERGIAIIEDASESLGAYYKQGPLTGLYSGAVGLLGCFSFNGNKIMTTGGGGMVVTSSQVLAERLSFLSTQAKTDSLMYQHDEVGYNYRLTNLQAALGLAQFEQLPEFIEKKKQHFLKYQAALSQYSFVKLIQAPDYSASNYWLFTIQFNRDISHRKWVSFFKEKGIDIRPIWQLNHLQKPYLHCQSFQISNAIHLYQSSLNIPSSVGLTDENLYHVVEVIKECSQLF